MALTDAKIRNTKPSAIPQKITDSGGLHVVVRPSGAKLWRYRYRIAGKENLFALGEYEQAPRGESEAEVEMRRAAGRLTLAEARTTRDQARALVRQGIHPAHNRQALMATQVADNANTFEAVAREWIAQRKPKWTTYYLGQVEGFLEADVFPYVGALPIRAVTAAQLLEIVKRVGKRAPTVALLLRQWCSAIFRYAVSTLRADGDPAVALKGAIDRPKVQHSKPLARSEIPDFLKALDKEGRVSDHGHWAAPAAAHVRSYRGIARCRMDGVRFGPRRMADPCRAHEDAGDPLRAPVAAGGRVAA